MNATHSRHLQQETAQKTCIASDQVEFTWTKSIYDVKV